MVLKIVKKEQHQRNKKGFEIRMAEQDVLLKERRQQKPLLTPALVRRKRPRYMIMFDDALGTFFTSKQRSKQNPTTTTTKKQV